MLFANVNKKEGNERKKKEGFDPLAGGTTERALFRHWAFLIFLSGWVIAIQYNIWPIDTSVG